MKKEILGKYILQTATPEYAKQEAELQKIVFRHLNCVNIGNIHNQAKNNSYMMMKKKKKI